MDMHIQYMDRVLDLAKQGRGNVSPNPMVGCILVKNNKIIGEGYHKSFGAAHAEVDALNNCIEDPSGSDLYVNLEPCNIFSKTPPCVNKIIENSIKNVYVGCIDKNPEVNGLGIQELKKSNINVFTDINSKKCYELNIGFFNWIKTGYPWVIVKIAQSNNGFMGINSDTTTLITGHDTNSFSHKLRSEVDGILVGTKTVEVDNPSLTVRNIAGSNPSRIIIDTNRKLPLTLKIFNDNEADNIILCNENNFNESKTPIGVCLPIAIKDNLLDPKDILKSLGKKGITKLLIEGGPTLINSFLKANLINEIYLYTSNDSLNNAVLQSPDINEEWEVFNENEFENDSLKIMRKKELCLQD